GAKRARLCIAAGRGIAIESEYQIAARTALTQQNLDRSGGIEQVLSSAAILFNTSAYKQCLAGFAVTVAAAEAHQPVGALRGTEQILIGGGIKIFAACQCHGEARCHGRSRSARSS